MLKPVSASFPMGVAQMGSWGEGRGLRCSPWSRRLPKFRCVWCSRKFCAQAHLQSVCLTWNLVLEMEH